MCHSGFTIVALLIYINEEFLQKMRHSVTFCGAIFNYFAVFIETLPAE